MELIQSKYQGSGHIIYDGLKASPQKARLRLSPQYVAALNQTGDAQDLPYTQKPAQQFLKGLGVKEDADACLSEKANKTPVSKEGNHDVTIQSFSSPQPDRSQELVITGKRIDRLRKSAKVYVNTDIVPKGRFAAVISTGTMKEQDQSLSIKDRTHWQNLAVGICHVQEIDLLTTKKILSNGKAVNTPRTGRIEEHDPALLLLSSPALNFRYGTAKHLSKDAQREYIAAMYRNLFHTTLQEKREYIALPAAGLGEFGGDPEMYFSTLMQVAKEFPQLNIIYHPAAYGKEFNDAVDKAKPHNVVKTSKDVMLIANELTQQEKP